MSSIVPGRACAMPAMPCDVGWAAAKPTGIPALCPVSLHRALQVARARGTHHQQSHQLRLLHHLTDLGHAAHAWAGRVTGRHPASKGGAHSPAALAPCQRLDRGLRQGPRSLPLLKEHHLIHKEINVSMIIANGGDLVPPSLWFLPFI